MSAPGLSADDRAELLDLVHRYAHLVDERRVLELSNLFAPDARLEFVSTGVIAEGRQAISDFFTTVFATPPLASGPGGGAQSTHLMANTIIQPGIRPGIAPGIEPGIAPGDGLATASMVTSAVAYLAADGSVTARGITYTDRCRRVEGRWVFAHRTHRLRWQGESSGGPVSVERSPLD